jgi:hypothetical protein
VYFDTPYVIQPGVRLTWCSSGQLFMDMIDDFGYLLALNVSSAKYGLCRAALTGGRFSLSTKSKDAFFIGYDNMALTSPSNLIGLAVAFRRR